MVFDDTTTCSTCRYCYRPQDDSQQTPAYTCLLEPKEVDVSYRLEARCRQYEVLE